MREHKIIKWIVFILVFIFLIIGYLGLDIYRKAYVPNVKVKKDTYLKIPTGSTYEDVIFILKGKKYLNNPETFEWVASRKNYRKHVYPGRYKLKNRMSNNELINMLRAGLQEPVNLTFNNIRTSSQFAAVISNQIEANPDSLLKLLNNNVFLSHYGFNTQTVIGMFIPNTYEFWWNTDSEDFFIKMNKEYEKFWTRERDLKAEAAGLSRNDVAVLASIVEEESLKDSEKSLIASVYINRLKKGIRLQADPTVKYALGNFSIRRVLKHHLNVESPYNTYKYAGLPPGPIRIPSITSIDAVLNYKKSNYYYFCAKDDFSGYHVFAETLTEHNQNARLYQRALNRRKILK